MALASTVREIGGVKYRIQQLPTLPGMRLYHRILKIVGPAITRALSAGVVNLGSLFGPNGKANLTAAALAANAIDELLNRLGEDDLMEFVRAFGEHTYVIGTNSETQLSMALNAGVAFDGRPGLVLLWLRACLEHSFASFLADLGITAPRVSDVQDTVSPSQSK